MFFSESEIISRRTYSTSKYGSHAAKKFQDGKQPRSKERSLQATYRVETSMESPLIDIRIAESILATLRANPHTGAKPPRKSPQFWSWIGVPLPPVTLTTSSFFVLPVFAPYRRWFIVTLGVCSLVWEGDSGIRNRRRPLRKMTHLPKKGYISL